MYCAAYDLPAANRVPFELWSLISSEFSTQELARYCGVTRSLFEIAMEKMYRRLNVCSFDWPWCERFEEALSNPIVASRVRSLGLDMRSALHMTRPEFREKYCLRRGKAGASFTEQDMFREVVRGFESIEALNLCSCQVHCDSLRTSLLQQTSCLVKVFAEVLPKLKILNLQVQPETFIELVDAAIDAWPSVSLQLQELSITLDSGLYASSERFCESLAKLVDKVSHCLTSFKLIAPYDNIHVPHRFFTFLGRSRLPHLSKIWFGLHTRPHYNSVPNLDGINMFLRNHAAQLQELHLTFYQRGTLALPPPPLLAWYQRCFQGVATGAKLEKLWLGACHPQELVPLYGSVLGPVCPSVTSLVCVRTQVDYDQLEALLSMPSCAQLKSLVLYYRGILTRQLAELFASKCPQLEQLCIRYERSTYKQEAPFQSVFRSQPWQAIEGREEWSYKVFLVWPQGLYMKLARGSCTNCVEQLMPVDMQVYGYTCETCAKPEDDESSRQNQCVVQ
ncbi:hypothetical protein APHAL10511_003974 [Amanita phalloides]|nr:hypothetical protein APHAL10511_003974 [Amanita phalloides]